MLPKSNYRPSVEKTRQKEAKTQSSARSMDGRTPTEVFEAERALLHDLIQYLEQEIEHVVGGDVTTLEESMPRKKKILDAIAANRGRHTLPQVRTGDGEAAKMRALKLDLVRLWKKVEGLNATSQELVNQRLSDIELRLAPFIQSFKTGYDRSGKVSKSVSHTIRSGV